MAGLPSIGYTVVICTCKGCGHRGHVDPARLTQKSRLYCRECGGRDIEFQRSYWDGKPPDNVTPIRPQR